ncbi:hypothetical protein V2J09_006487 [Rumex salicifolius]
MKKSSDGSNNNTGNKKARTDDQDNRPKCHYYHKLGHFKRDCKFLKKKQQEIGNQANTIEKQVSEIITMGGSSPVEAGYGSMAEGGGVAGSVSGGTTARSDGRQGRRWDDALLTANDEEGASGGNERRGSGS